MLHGCHQGQFRGRKGFRQGDLISPLLFVVIPEYLTGALLYHAPYPQFMYHLMCKTMKQVNIYFADDLMIFGKQHIHTVQLVIKAFSHFSNSIGLTANKQKSQTHIAGMAKRSMEGVLAMTVFAEGTFSIKYLAVPLSQKKWSVIECQSIVEKIVVRIKCQAARHVSFAGTAKLINSILFAMHSYQPSLFILPKCIIKQIKGICRNFLWS